MAADKVAADKERRGFSTLSFFCLWHLGLACEGVPFWRVARWVQCGNLDSFTPAPHSAKARPPPDRCLGQLGGQAWPEVRLLLLRLSVWRSPNEDRQRLYFTVAAAGDRHVFAGLLAQMNNAACWQAKRLSLGPGP